MALEINGDAVHTLHSGMVGFQSPWFLFMRLSGSKFKSLFTLTVIKSLEVTKLLRCWMNAIGCFNLTGCNQLYQVAYHMNFPGTPIGLNSH